MVARNGFVFQYIEVVSLEESLVEDIKMSLALDQLEQTWLEHQLLDKLMLEHMVRLRYLDDRFCFHEH